MFTRKNRILLALVAAVVAIAVLPASSFALKAKPTGNANLDSYCQQAAALIDHALSQGDLELLAGHDDEAAAWYHLAAEMIGRSQDNGCQFVSGRKVRHILHDYPVVAPVQGPPGAPTTGTPSSGSGPTKPRLPVGSLVPISGPTS